MKAMKNDISGTPRTGKHCAHATIFDALPGSGDEDPYVAYISERNRVRKQSGIASQTGNTSVRTYESK
jgi:hypothetical protein